MPMRHSVPRRKNFFQVDPSSRCGGLKPRLVIRERMAFLDQLPHRPLKSNDFVGLRIFSGTHARASRNVAFDDHCPRSRTEREPDFCVRIPRNSPLESRGRGAAVVSRAHSIGEREALYGLGVARVQSQPERMARRTAVMRARSNRSVETLRIQYLHHDLGARPVRPDRCNIGRFSHRHRCQIRWVSHAGGQC